MTGFARREGTTGTVRWVWELRSVNGKGLDLRLRTPPGHDRLEPKLRAACQRLFTRGNIQAGLTLTPETSRLDAIVNEDALAAVIALAKRLEGEIDAAPPRLDGLLAIRGVLEIREPDEDEATVAARHEALVEGFGAALEDLKEMRLAEGRSLEAILLNQISDIEKIVARIEADPSRQTDAIRERLAIQVAQLLDASAGSIDPARLHAEAALLATKADIREELDRLSAHVAAARDLIATGGPVGRRLDFLAQEFNRESNTICSKSNAAAVTAAGLDLKVVVDQFREQIQNLE